jgi:hypothetical protein
VKGLRFAPDNLNLYAVLDVFKIRNIEEFERAINSGLILII